MSILEPGLKGRDSELGNLPKIGPYSPNSSTKSLISSFLLVYLSGWLAQVLLSAACLSWREDSIDFSEVHSYVMATWMLRDSWLFGFSQTVSLLSHTIKEKKFLEVTFEIWRI